MARTTRRDILEFNPVTQEYQANPAVVRSLPPDVRKMVDYYVQKRKPWWVGKTGRKIRNPEQSDASHPGDVPQSLEALKATDEKVESLHRIDHLKKISYSQLWILVRERRVDSVRVKGDRRSMLVTTNSRAPGGARTEKVAIPFDPDLYSHLEENGVAVALAPQQDTVNVVWEAIVRWLLPFYISLLIFQLAFRFGRKKKRDEFFGGVELIEVKRG